MKQFVTAARQAAPTAIDGAEPIEFDLDGEQFTAYPPTTGQMALVMEGQSSHDIGRRIAAVINFMDSLLDTRGQSRFRQRLMDRDDPFELEQVQEIVDWLLEEWTGNPTESPSGSSRSRRSTGRRSTATAPSVE